MSKCVLIAEDGDPARQVLRKALEHAGFVVCAEAVDGVDTVDKASKLKPDLIVTDLRLPLLNGLEVAQILGGRLPKTPIVLFTMYDVSPALLSASGIRAVVRKSDGVHELVRRIETLFAPPPDIGEILPRASSASAVPD
jgi:DNA-binding NarL/FixJ family response regulator